ncbi:IS200/IS605 family transposase [uncultured Treponema sp.]|uniref:IS200/IS605 family transposase n=1 Tax=uncultured Treponema sp. TaxID=162155 RepID=UPI00259A6D6A|nr:IS200/IS605 family transposase [uncultured Treponema sp.]
MEDEHIYKNHNKTMLLYHLVFPAKYRRKVFTEEVGERLKEICMEIKKCYEIRFVEIGMEEDHVHFLVQSVPKLAVTRIVTIIKSITAREIFMSYPRIKKEILWGGALWTSGYYANTVGLYASKETITRYIQNQGQEKREYKKIYENQPELDFGL